MSSLNDLDFMKSFARMCGDGWLQGWHERNGGNMSYRMTKEEAEAAAPLLDDGAPWRASGIAAPEVAGELFAVTGTGKYFRNIAPAPDQNVCIVEIGARGESWRVVKGREAGVEPTSEWPTHMACHAIRKRATGGRDRVIYHAHPTNIVAMTFVLPVTARDITRALWQSETECAVVFPGGVGAVEWMVPGGDEIAARTAALMHEYSAVVWARHGLFATGADFDEAFGLMHTIEKAAEIYMCALHTGMPFLDTIPDEGIRAINRKYGGKLREEFLD